MSWPQGQLVFDCTPIAGTYVRRPQNNSDSRSWVAQTLANLVRPIQSGDVDLCMLHLFVVFVIAYAVYAS